MRGIEQEFFKPDYNIRSELSFTAVRLQMKKDDQLLATGTGFFYEVDDYPYLITNRHNLTGCDQNSGEPLDQGRRIPNSLVLKQPKFIRNGKSVDVDGNQLQTLCLRWNPGAPPWKEHPELAGNIDVVAIDIWKAAPNFPKPFFCVNTLPSLSSLIVAPSHRVSVIGYPFGVSVAGYYPIWVNGSVASEPEINVDNKPLFYIDCRTNKGSSGSPVFATAPVGLVTTESLPDFKPHGLVYTRPDGTVSWTSPLPLYRFLGIYSGRINSQADIGCVWKVAAIDKVCRNTEYVFERDKIPVDPSYKLDLF